MTFARSAARAPATGRVSKASSIAIGRGDRARSEVAPLAGNVGFTENGVRLEVGDGHWQTVTGTGTYRMFVTDPAAGRCVHRDVREEARDPDGLRRRSRFG